MSVWKWLKQRKFSHQKGNRKADAPQAADELLQKHKNEQMGGNVEETVAFFENLLGQSDDFSVRRFRVFGRYPAALMNFGKLVDESLVNDDILKALMNLPPQLEDRTIAKDEIKDVLLNDVLYYTGCTTESELDVIAEEVLRGRTLIAVDGMREAILLETRSIDKRAVAEPETERVIRGSRDGFIEILSTNIGLLRYRLPTADFRVRMMKVGRLTKTKIAVCYLENIVNPSLVKEVERRIKAIDIDGVIDSGYIEQFIEDHHASPFPQVQYTERPDRAVANLKEGRVIILVDGTPFALIVPAVFHQFYQTTEDYSERFLIGTLVRMIRIVAIVFSIIFPSLYVSLISYNPELIPTEFAVAVAGGRAGVPYPPVIEVLIMEISMEVLREATIRLPQQVGGALSIVGVLVVGEAAVSAGLASPITVVVIALATIGSFATPAYNAAIALRMLRFPLILLAGIFGLYGVMVGLILIINHVLSLRSFGVPYLSPVVPANWQGMKDTLIRGPLWWMYKRPGQLHPVNNKRVGQKTARLEKAPSNTLDPLKVGSERWEDPDGVSTRDYRTPSNRDSH